MAPLRSFLLSACLVCNALSEAINVEGRPKNTLPYLDPSLSPVERADDLLERMNWTEKIGQMGGIRRLLSGGLSFNRTTYDSIRTLQNGIIGVFCLPYMING